MTIWTIRLPVIRVGEMLSIVEVGSGVESSNTQRAIAFGWKNQCFSTKQLESSVLQVRD